MLHLCCKATGMTTLATKLPISNRTLHKHQLNQSSSKNQVCQHGNGKLYKYMTCVTLCAMMYIHSDIILPRWFAASCLHNLCLKELLTVRNS